MKADETVVGDYIVVEKEYNFAIGLPQAAVAGGGQIRRGFS
jgi:hypothetical protein